MVKTYFVIVRCNYPFLNSATINLVFRSYLKVTDHKASINRCHVNKYIVTIYYYYFVIVIILFYFQFYFILFYFLKIQHNYLT